MPPRRVWVAVLNSEWMRIKAWPAPTPFLQKCSLSSHWMSCKGAHRVFALCCSRHPGWRRTVKGCWARFCRRRWATRTCPSAFRHLLRGVRGMSHVGRGRACSRMPRRAHRGMQNVPCHSHSSIVSGSIDVPCCRHCPRVGSDRTPAPEARRRCGKMQRY